MADGSIVFSTALDNSDLEKGIKQAENEIEELKRKISEKTEERNALVEQLVEVKEQIIQAEKKYFCLFRGYYIVEKTSSRDGSIVFSKKVSTADMTKYARQIWSSAAKYRNVATKMHRMVMRLNNIYSVGEYFFIDFSVENKTNIRFDIDELRVKLSDKKQSKATNAQIVELTPALVLDDAKTFKYGYRNVIVVKKMTFPNDKVLTIELSEKQISGRTISLSIDYEDVLSADSFNHILLEEE